MRIFEILFFCSNALTLVLLFPIKGLKKNHLLISLGLTILSLGGHILIEKTRWQMVPVIVFSVVLVLIVLYRVFNKNNKHTAAPRRWLWTSTVILLLLILLPPLLFPVPSLPKPTGPYSVGTTSFAWTDENRIETLTPNPVENRKIMIQVWYPADETDNAVLAPYMEQLEITGPVLAGQFNLPAFLFDHISLAKTHSYLNIPVSSGENNYPVLIFSHGWTGVRNQNTYQAEELASHGYIVLAPDHTYGAGLVVFPDGSGVLNNPDLLP